MDRDCYNLSERYRSCLEHVWVYFVGVEDIWAVGMWDERASILLLEDTFSTIMTSDLALSITNFTTQPQLYLEGQVRSIVYRWVGGRLTRRVPSVPDMVASHPARRPTDRCFLTGSGWNPMAGLHRELSKELSRFDILGHPKQHKKIRYTRLIDIMFELMIAIALNSRLATSFVLTVTRRRAWHLEWILNDMKLCMIFISLNTFELMTGITLNSWLATSFILTMTRRHAWHLACILRACSHRNMGRPKSKWFGWSPRFTNESDKPY